MPRHHIPPLPRRRPGAAGKAALAAGAAALLGLAAGAPARAQPAAPGISGALATTAPAHLGQGWSDATRRWMYGFTQGSQIMPYDWFRALEVPDGTAPFRADGLARFGYLPRARTPDNPDGLPVGFAPDRDRMGVHLGMNCAACHTARIAVGGRVVQVDGAPAGADMYAFIEGVRAALRATLDDPAKFERFSAAVRATNRELTAAALRGRLEAFAADWTRYVEDSRAGEAWGPARLDAFGMIFNRVAGMDLGLRENIAPPDAPVSYPFLWTTSRQDRTQWDGSVPNEQPHERLGRNVGQVLGVFGRMPGLASPEAFRDQRFASTARGPNLLRVDWEIRGLRSPRWAGPAVDEAAAARGRALYETAGGLPGGCGSCHARAGHGVAGFGTVRTALTPLGALRTDERTARNIADRRVRTGVLEGEGSGIPFLGQPLPRQAAAGDLLAVVVMRVILDASTWRSLPAAPGLLAAAAAPAAAGTRTAVTAALRNTAAPVYTGARDPGALHYKAGPLDGVWATAPYLHNGSVPTLADLLLPAAQRPAAFTVGSRVLDPDRVGLLSGPGDGAFRFDTARPGNGNGGHEGPEYGTTLTPEQRRDLLEYLKTL